MAARIIDGKAAAAAVLAEVKARVDAFRAAKGRPPGLAVVLVGEDPASQVYVRNKGREAEAAGFRSEQHTLPVTTSQADLLALVARLNADRAHSRDHILSMFSLTIVAAAWPVSLATAIFAGLFLMPSGMPAPVPS